MPNGPVRRRWSLTGSRSEITAESGGSDEKKKIGADLEFWVFLLFFFFFFFFLDCRMGAI